jgi:hypothetical protein
MKYPQAEFPYLALVEANRRRSRGEMEYELIDTGIFDNDRYYWQADLAQRCVVPHAEQRHHLHSRRNRLGQRGRERNGFGV